MEQQQKIRQFVISEPLLRSVLTVIHNSKHDFTFGEIAGLVNSLQSLKEIQEDDNLASSTEDVDGV